MPVQIIVGAQWGDEGKGKIVDHLSEKVNIVARYQGGANAGHTVVLPPAKGKKGNEREYVLHLIPSGIFHNHVTCVIGNGVVLDPIALMDEKRQRPGAGIGISGRLLGRPAVLHVGRRPQRGRPKKNAKPVKAGTLVRKGLLGTYQISGVGIFQRTAGAVARALYLFKPQVRLPRNLQFYATARRVIRTVYPQAVQRLVNEAFARHG